MFEHAREFPTARVAMPFIDTAKLEAIERKPGWHGRYFQSPSMTFAHYEFEKGSAIHTHFHPQEEVWTVIEGELEFIVDGIAHVVGPGMAAIVPPDTAHSARALTDGKAIVVDYPLRNSP
jgi:quercetin dioxygenase-like cupin family protein